MRFLALASLALVAALSLSATLAPGNTLLRMVEFVPGRDVTVHFGMLGLTAFAVTRAFTRRRERFRWRQLGPGAVLLIAATAEEFSQRWIIGRTFSMEDLLANTLGIVVFTGLALLRRPVRRRPVEPGGEARTTA